MKKENKLPKEFIIFMIATTILFIINYFLLNNVGTEIVNRYVYESVDNNICLSILFVLIVLIKMCYSFVFYRIKRDIQDQAFLHRLWKYYLNIHGLLFIFNVAILYRSLMTVFDNYVMIDNFVIPILYYIVFFGVFPVVHFFVDFFKWRTT